MTISQDQTGEKAIFYEPEQGHGLPYNPFNAIVTPRPIGWISTRDAQGRNNLAPYSFFNAVAYVPPQVMFASTGEKPDQNGTKDSVANIRETGVFCVNIVEHAMIGQMNASAATLPYDTNEYEQAGLRQIACNIINCSRVSGAPAALECKLTQIINLPGAANFAVFGEVIGVHMREDCIENGRFDVTKFKPLTRLGYRDYAIIEKTFELARPDEGKNPNIKPRT